MVERKLFSGVAILILVLLPSLVGAETKVTPLDVEVTQPFRVRVIWNDHHRLLPHGYERMRTEVEAIFREHGIDVRIRLASEVDAEAAAPTIEVLATLMPSEPAGWKLAPEVNGVTIGGAGQKSIFIFFPRVLASLNQKGTHWSKRSRKQAKDLARAMARVLAHEVVHVIAPDAPHTAEGLMNTTLDRSALTRARLEWSSSTKIQVGAVVREALVAGP
jgi:hypothetical protein